MRTLDPTDIKILNLLQQDARLEVKQIAGLVHKSISPTHQRIKKLLQEGYIKKYVAILDHKKIGYTLLAITQVTLATHTQTSINEFETYMNSLPEVQTCLHLSGKADFMLQITTTDTEAYHHFLMNHLANIPNIHHIDTHFVLKECKTSAPVVL